MRKPSRSEGTVNSRVVTPSERWKSRDPGAIAYLWRSRQSLAYRDCFSKIELYVGRGPASRSYSSQALSIRGGYLRIAYCWKSVFSFITCRGRFCSSGGGGGAAAAAGGGAGAGGPAGRAS